MINIKTRLKMRLPIHGVEHYIRGNYFLDIKILICFLVISFDNIVTLSGKYVVRVVHQRYHGFLALEYKRLQQAVESGTKRIAEIDRLIEKVFEQNASGVLSDERFAKMLQNYEAEQKKLTQEVADNQQALQNAEQQVVDLRLVLRTLREMTDIQELTPTLVNSLIERIEVHNNDKYDGHCHVKVDIYFTAVGMIDIPTEKEIQAMVEEIRKNPQDFKFVA